MRVLAGLAAVLLSIGQAQAGGYVLGMGQDSCTRAIEIDRAGTDFEKGQLYGWIVGVWSQESFHREDGFTDTVERVGSVEIIKATLAQCAKAPDTRLFRVVQGMMQNTK